MSEGKVEGCPCGLSGENCSVLDDGINNIDQALSETCFLSGFDSCLVKDNEAICVCKCGHIGDLCETKVEPELYIFSKISLYFLHFSWRFYHDNTFPPRVYKVDNVLL